jgi:hypothetical protein
MVDGPAPGEREETDTKEGERMIVGKGRSTVVVIINYYLLTIIITYCYTNHRYSR